MAEGASAILLDLVLVLVVAKLGGELVRRFGQPPLIGEIMGGLLVGPSLLNLLPPLEVELSRTGAATDVAAPAEAEVLLFLAQFGVLLLLFEVGLETDFKAFRRTGLSAGLVGFLGVAISLAAGFAASYLIAPYVTWIITDNALANPTLLHVFIGATLTATSVGITARVLTDLQVARTPESQIILGAAVFDDVLGLIVLALVSAFASAAALTFFGVAKIFVVALGFFFAAVIVGVWIGPRFMRGVHRAFKADYVHLAFALLFMLLVSYLATLAGLAAIVGAFAAGLALNGSEHRHTIFEHTRPVASLFVSFFFVLLGARINLREIAGDTALIVVGVGLLLTVVGVIAKVGAGLGVVRVKASRYVVGVGMVPRGEVGLIFAVFGLEHALVTNWQYTSLILVVLLTTIVTGATVGGPPRRRHGALAGLRPHGPTCDARVLPDKERGEVPRTRVGEVVLHHRLHPQPGLELRGKDAVEDAPRDDLIDVLFGREAGLVLLETRHAAARDEVPQPQAPHELEPLRIEPGRDAPSTEVRMHHDLGPIERIPVRPVRVERPGPRDLAEGMRPQGLPACGDERRAMADDAIVDDRDELSLREPLLVACQMCVPPECDLREQGVARMLKLQDLWDVGRS
ncbi:MAG: cation:proton antiporter, partial [Euryarchaeota archaeon]|nr:cation:proton antiporter [Euryarchaeota archaeon]